MTEYRLFLEKLRSSISTSDFIGRFIKLRKYGHEYNGLCPFHNEKSPSFTVNDNKRFYHCFGCGAHGDVIKFIMEIKRIEFKEAIELLASEASIPIPVFTPRNQNSSDQDLVEKLYLINQEASLWFEKNLSQYNSSSIREYLKDRGIKEAFIKKFRLGYSNSDGNQLKEFLMNKGSSLEELMKSGIIAKTEKNSFYDRFRSRVIFPIFDYKGRVIAFGGRILQQHAHQAKYINSAESLIFNKSETLYGENFAKESARQKNRVILVEGYIDVIMMHQTGFEETVATLGTAITLNHLKKLWNLSKNLIIFLDNDVAGRKAMLKIAELAVESIKAGFNLKFAVTRLGKDPADLCNQVNYKEIDILLERAIPLSEMLWLEYKNLFIRNNTPEEIAFLETNLNSLLNKIQDKTIKENFRLFFKERVWHEFRTKNKYKLPKIENNKINLLEIRDLSLRERLEWSLIVLIARLPILLKKDDIFEEFSNFAFENQKLQKISSFIIEIFLNNITYLENSILKEWIFKLLKEKVLEEDINLLYQDNSLFISKVILENQNTSSTFFKIIILKIEVINLQQEYEKQLAEFTESSINKAKLIFEEIRFLKEKIEKLELLNYD